MLNSQDSCEDVMKETPKSFGVISDSYLVAIIIGLG